MFEGIGIVARVPSFGGNGHGRRGKVLYLFEVEIELLGNHCQLGHIFFLAAWVAADEVRDNLLAQVLLAIDAVEDTLKLVELLKRGFAHEHEYAVAGMLGGYLEATTDVIANEFAGVLLGGLVGGFVFTAMEQQVVANTTADKALLNARQGIYRMIDVEQGLMVRVEVRTYLGMDTTGSATFLTGIEVASVHAVHIGRWAAKVGEIALEVGHLDNLLHLF